MEIFDTELVIWKNEMNMREKIANICDENTGHKRMY